MIGTINPDTNLLVRLLARDDQAQRRIALEVFGAADRVVISIPAVCEVVWVLSRLYGYSRLQIAGMLEELPEMRGADIDLRALRRGIEMLKAGGDFADGAIAESGYQKGAAFVSFNRKAVSRLREMKLPAMLAGER